MGIIKCGDVMLLDVKNNNHVEFTHATLITKLSSNDIFYTAHTAPQKNQSLSSMIKKKKVFNCCIIILKDGAK